MVAYSPFVNDSHLLLFTLVVTVVFQLAFFSVAFTFKFDKVTDFAGGSNFVVLALLTLISGGYHHARQIVATLAVCVWGIRLSGFLLYRVIKTGKDDRFDGTRDNFFKFLSFWAGQMLWVWTVSLPVTFLNTTEVNPSLSAADVAGLTMFVVGFLFEVIGDIQKDIFKSEGGRGVCTTGLWYYTRHPNYFGELLLWWGIFTGCSSVFDAAYAQDEGSWGYGTVAGPMFTTVIILFASGIPTVESSWDKKYGSSEAYWDYKETTSLLFPMPPSIFKALPTVVKTWLLFEWPIYQESSRAESLGAHYVPAPSGVDAK